LVNTCFITCHWPLYKNVHILFRMFQIVINFHLDVPYELELAFWVPNKNLL
jgi:hypothetical protein